MKYGSFDTLRGKDKSKCSYLFLILYTTVFDICEINITCIIYIYFYI